MYRMLPTEVAKVVRSGKCIKAVDINLPEPKGAYIKIYYRDLFNEYLSQHIDLVNLFVKLTIVCECWPHLNIKIARNELAKILDDKVKAESLEMAKQDFHAYLSSMEADPEHNHEQSSDEQAQHSEILAIDCRGCE